MGESYRRKPDIEEAPLHGELMLFDPGRSQFFVLNETMAHVWKRCDGEATFQEVVRSMSDAFEGVEERPLAVETQAALDELLELGLVTKV